MIFYVGIFAIVLLFALLEQYLSSESVNREFKHVSKSLIVFLCYIFLLFLIVLRSTRVGGDLINYQNSYRVWSRLSLSEILSVGNSDMGFVLWNWLLSKLVPNFLWFMRIHSALSFSLIFFVINKMSKNTSLGILVFISIGGLADVFSNMRQCLAIGIVMLAVYLWHKGNRILSVIIWLFSLCIHSTAIIGLLYYLVVFSKTYTSLLVKSIVLAWGFILIDLFGIPFLVQQYAINDYSKTIVSGEGLKQLFLLIAIVILACILMRKQKYDVSNEVTLSINAVCIATVIQILAVGFSLLNRLQLYYIYFLPILVTNIMYRKKSKKVIFILVGISCFAYYCYTIILNNSGIVPYEFYWQYN